MAQTTRGVVYDATGRQVLPTNLIFLNQIITNSLIDGVLSSAIATNSAATKLDITNGTPVIAGVTIRTNTLAHLEIGGLFPLTADATNYWAAGDSWTYGQFVVAHQWTSAGSPYLMFSPLLYCNILSTNYGLNLTNRGVSGSRLARTAGAPDSTLAQLNVVPTSWSGLVTLAHGYNDSTTETYGDTSRTHTLFRNAATAAITKLLAYDYGNAQGKRLDGTTLGGWSTAGSVTDGGNAGKAPFPTGSAATNTVQFLTLTSTQTLTFNATNAVVWLENSSAGGVVQLWQGTNWIATADLSTPSQLYFLPQALVARGRSGTFTLTNVSGSNVVLGAGSLNNPADTLAKSIVLMAPGRLGASGRMDSVGKSIGQAYASAAQDYQEFRVFFADVPSRLDLSTMIPSGDADHPDPRGHIAIVDAIKNAVHAPANSDLNSPGTRYVQGGLQVQGGQIATAQLKSGPSVSIAMATGDTGYLDSIDFATSTYYPLNVRAKSVNVTSSGLAVSGSYASITDYPVADFAALSYSSGVGRLVSISYNGTTATYKPMILGATSTRLDQGGLAVLSASTTNDLPIGNMLSISQSGGTGYLDAINFTGAPLTYIPLELRAKTTSFGSDGTGAVLIRGGNATTADYPEDDFMVLAFASSQAYIGSNLKSGTNVTYLPLNLQTKYTQVGTGGTGPLLVSGTLSSVTNYPVASFVATALSGGQGYIDATSFDGTNATYLPLNLRASSIALAAPTEVTGTLSATGAAISGTIELGHATDTTLARSAAGVVSVEGVNLSTVNDTTIWVDAGAMAPFATGGAAVATTTLATTGIPVDEYAFDASAIEKVAFKLAFPAGWNGSTLTATFYWRTTATSGNCVWTISARLARDGDNPDTTFGTAQSVTDGAIGTANYQAISSATSTIVPSGTFGSGAVVYFIITRDATNGSDTLASDALLGGVSLTWK